MLSHMDDGHQTSPEDVTQPTESPQPPLPDKVPKPLTADKTVTPASLPVDDYDKQLEKDKQTIRKLGIAAAVVAIIMIGLFVGLIFTVSGAYTAKNATNKSGGDSSTSNVNLTPTEKNPAATGNASASAEGSYCSNAINATLSC
jgi:hypothetical protein